MGKLKYYILISRNLKNLKRHFSPDFSNIPKERGVVVINTTDKEYQERASRWCEGEGIEYHITPSNGTAARGKNCLIEIFLKSDNDYMVQVDGDDFLTPHGVWMYDYLATTDNPPDAICLKNQFSVSLHAGKEFLWAIDSETTLLSKYSFFFVTDWEKVANQSLVNGLLQMGVDSYKAYDFDKFYHEFYRLQKKYCDDNESHCRVTWMSRKALKHHRFPEHMKVGEDTIFYFYLKNDGLTGKLDVYCNDDRPPTYVYDQTMAGVVREEIEDGKNWAWMEIYNNEVYKLESENIVHEKDLPVLEVEYPTDYIPNVINLPIRTIAPYDNQRGIELPLNASQKNINEKIKQNDFYYYQSNS